MARLYLVRHGQGSFGTHDYDRLSSTGVRQAQECGRYLASVATNASRIVSGSLVRQRDTAVEITRCLSVSPVVAIDERCNELDIDGQIARANLVVEANTSTRVYQKLVRQAFLRWQTLPQTDLETWTMFASRVTTALEEIVRTSGPGETTIVVSSAGVIATAVAHVLGLPAQSVYPLFEVMMNCSVTCLLHDRERISLSSFNECAYLAAELRTYR